MYPIQQAPDRSIDQAWVHHCELKQPQWTSTIVTAIIATRVEDRYNLVRSIEDLGGSTSESLGGCLGGCRAFFNPRIQQKMQNNVSTNGLVNPRLQLEDGHMASKEAELCCKTAANGSKMEQLVEGQVIINSDDYQGDHNGNNEIDIGRSDTSKTEDSSDNNSETDNKETSNDATKDFTTIKNARPCRMRTLRAATFCNDEATVRATGRRLGPSSLKQVDKSE